MSTTKYIIGSENYTVINNSKNSPLSGGDNNNMNARHKVKDWLNKNKGLLEHPSGEVFLSLETNPGCQQSHRRLEKENMFTFLAEMLHQTRVT